MEVLVIGSGAREHCLAFKLSQSPIVDKIYCAPGNGGTAQLGENLDIKINDFKSLLNFAVEKKIGLTVVGPEAPLAEGLVDQFKQKGLTIFGPNRDLARLESSKIFAKEMMRKFNIPTADFKVFTSANKAKDHIDQTDMPVVVKADGLAAGKGVMVCLDKKEAKAAVDSMMEDKIFGSAGNKIIIEECLKGEELSVLVLTDGETILPLAGSQDHKRIFDNDQGPNTGGMGAYSPVSWLGDKNLKKIIDIVFRPLLDGLRREGKIYKGVLYAGLMVCDNQVYVLEFNVRFGDPETQAILPRLKSDLAEVMLKSAESQLGSVELEWDSRSCVCVVLASGGYPGSYQKGKEISGIKAAEKIQDVFVYHAGTEQKKGNQQSLFLTTGGRVLSVAGLGLNLREAQEKAYQGVEKIHFDSMQYRKDIGSKGLKTKAKN